MIIPSDENLSFVAQLLVWWEAEIFGPVHDLAVGVVWLFGTERRPADQTLKHDCTHTPPIAAFVISLTAKDLRSDVVRRTNRRICELSARLAPGVDLVAVRYRQLDLINADGVTVLADRFGSVWRHELLIIRCCVLFGEAGGKTEISQFDVPTTVKEDVVWLDIADRSLAVEGFYQI